VSGIADEERNGGLNASQRRHLLTSCQYADKLLAEIEAVLASSQSKSPFPKFRPDVSPTQAKVIQDYLARIRSQLVRILDGQGVAIPEPMFGSLHSIRVTLGFVDIAFDECRPKRMAGYGELAPGAGTAISGLVDEMQGIVSRLETYLAQGVSADFAARFERLESAGEDLGLVKTLERAIDRHGLVEFRPALATILDRLESRSFEIAVFGRVSSGKSSLLNYVVGRDLLPVGVNPITAVPTRVIYGPEPRATAWFADRKPENLTLDRLAEYVTEERNPGNTHHVTRIVVELPASRLREGIVYVDTPGLGGLASSGAAETKAYLPKCDLGLVLIDAGATLTQDDIGTIQTLCDAGITAAVLLSKADLLDDADRDRARQYVADHIRSELGLNLGVHAISIRPGYAHLLESWLECEILPLYDRHSELARQSLNRKIGALRLAVEAALKVQLKRSRRPPTETAKLKELESELRVAAGKIAEARAACVDATDELRDSTEELIHSAAIAITAQNDKCAIAASIERAAAERSARISTAIDNVAKGGLQALVHSARALGLDSEPDLREFADIVKSMPRFDLGSTDLRVRKSSLARLLGKRFALWSSERRVSAAAGEQIRDAVQIYARVLQSWVRKTFADLQGFFDSYADAHRAQLSRLVSDSPADVLNEETVQTDLAALGAAPKDAIERSA